MPAGAGDLSFYLQPGFGDPDGERPLFVRLSVGQDVVLEMIPNPTVLRSSLSRQALRDLRTRGVLEGGGPTFVLRDLRISGQPVADLTVRVGAAATLLRVDGILGFDFFLQFSAVVLEPRTLRVTLIDP